MLDGTSVFDAKFLKADAADLQPVLSKQFVRLDEIDGAVSGFVVNTGSKLVLSTRGRAASGRQRARPPRGQLEEGGVQARTVDIVLLTHLHADHVGGLARARAHASSDSCGAHGPAEKRLLAVGERCATGTQEAQILHAGAQFAKPYIAARSGVLCRDRTRSCRRHPTRLLATRGPYGNLFTSKGQTMLCGVTSCMRHRCRWSAPTSASSSIRRPTAIKTRQDSSLIWRRRYAGGRRAHAFPSLGGCAKRCRLRVVAGAVQGPP